MTRPNVLLIYSEHGRDLFLGCDGHLVFLVGTSSKTHVDCIVNETLPMPNFPRFPSASETRAIRPVSSASCMVIPREVGVSC
jgi:hypothetical protein